MLWRKSAHKKTSFLVCAAVLLSMFNGAYAQSDIKQVTGNVQYKLVGSETEMAPFVNARIRVFSERDLQYENNGVSSVYYDHTFDEVTYTDAEGNFVLDVDVEGLNMPELGQIYVGVCGRDVQRYSYSLELDFEVSREYRFTKEGGEKTVKLDYSTYDDVWTNEYYSLYAIDLDGGVPKNIVLNNAATAFDGTFGVYFSSELLCDWGFIYPNIAASFRMTRQSDNKIIFEYDGMNFTTADESFTLPDYNKSKKLVTFSGLDPADAYVIEAQPIDTSTGLPLDTFVPRQSLLVIDGEMLSSYASVPYYFVENRQPTYLPYDSWVSSWHWNYDSSRNMYNVSGYSPRLYRTRGGERFDLNYEIEDGRLVNEPFRYEIEVDENLEIREMHKYSSQTGGSVDIMFYNDAGESFSYKTALPFYDGEYHINEVNLQEQLDGFDVRRIVMTMNKDYPVDMMNKPEWFPNIEFRFALKPGVTDEILTMKVGVEMDFGAFTVSEGTYGDLPTVSSPSNFIINTQMLGEDGHLVPLANVPIDIYRYRYNENPQFIMHTTTGEEGNVLLQLESGDYLFRVEEHEGYMLHSNGYSTGGINYYDGATQYAGLYASYIPLRFIKAHEYDVGGVTSSYNNSIHASLGEDVKINIGGIESENMFKNFEVLAYIPSGFTIRSITVPAYDAKVGFSVETMEASKDFNPTRNVLSSLDMRMRQTSERPYYTDVQNVIPIQSPGESTGNRIIAVKLKFDTANYGFKPTDNAPITMSFGVGNNIADFTTSGENRALGNIDIQINKRYSESTLNRSVSSLKTVALTLGTDVGVLKVSNTSSNHNALAGSKFVLYASDMETVLLSGITTDSNGEATIRHMAPGTYYLKQTAAPSGYTLNTTMYPLQISNDTPFEITVINLSGSGGGPGPSPSPPPTGDYQTHYSYIVGFPGNYFNPGAGITRAQVAQILFNVSNDPNKFANVGTHFPDVPSDEWYTQPINYLAYKGVLNGYSDGLVRPERPITRAELAKCIAEFSELDLSGHSNPFSDVIPGYWALPYISAQASVGWISGYPDNTFLPENSATRAEALTMINKMLNRKVKNIDILQPGLRHFNDVEPSYWAYADIMEALNSHEFTRGSDGYEIWTSIIE